MTTNFLNCISNQGTENFIAAGLTNHPPLIYVIAIAVAAGLGFASFGELQFWARSDSSIATVSFINGVVQYRHRGAASWERAMADQQIFAGDRISTGGGAVAMVSFKGGQMVDMAGNSQAELDIKHGKDEESSVMIIRGSAKISGANASAISGKLIGGKPSVIYRKGERICLSADSGPGASTECPVGEQDDVVGARPVLPRTAVTNPEPSKEAEVVTKKISEVMIKPPIIAAVAPDKQSPVRATLEVTAKGFESSVVGADGGEIVQWATKGLESESLSLVVRLRPPTNKSAIANWSPVLEITGRAGEGRGVTLVGTSRWTAQDFPVSIKSILAVAKQDSSSGIRGVTFQVRSGDSVTAGGVKAADTSFSQVVTRYRLHSFSDVGSEPVKIGLRRFKKAGSVADWINQDPTFQQASAGVTINLSSGRDVSRLIPYLRDGGFSINSTKSNFGGEIFIVRKMEIVASLTGQIEGGAVSEMRTVLDGDFAFRGERTAFYDSRNKSSEELKIWVDSLVSAGGQVYVMRGDQLFPISKSFLQMKDQVLQFVGENAPYIFSQKVTLMNVRPGL
jgi:hypothetical protein